MRGPEDRTNGHDDVIEIHLDTLLDSLEFEGTEVPDEAEAAAIASAVGTYLADRQRAVAGQSVETTETVPEWKLAGRFESVGWPSRRRPRNVERGREWQAAAHSL
ncbi:hypothetical protein [Halorientalis salina]|uniref:hypothetical protein n=1 Tax=Halorientalis salina TaxID=2932266 RepID=UPI0010AD4F77|nr:hypothetical protein [Halorientalis salina]